MRSQRAWDNDLPDADHLVTFNFRSGTEVSGKVVLAILINIPPTQCLPHVLLFRLGDEIQYTLRMELLEEACEVDILACAWIIVEFSAAKRS